MATPHSAREERGVVTSFIAVCYAAVQCGATNTSLVPRPHLAHVRRRGLVSQVQKRVSEPTKAFIGKEQVLQ